MAVEYPYVVIRWMSAVYGERRVAFLRTAEEVSAATDVIAVLDPTPGADDVTAERREWLIDAVKRKSAEIRKDMCVVFGPEYSVFIEPNGSTKVQGEAPSGGVRLDNVRAR